MPSHCRALWPMSTKFGKFGVDSSSYFPFRARTHWHTHTHTHTHTVTDVTDHPTHASDAAGG